MFNLRVLCVRSAEQWQSEIARIGGEPRERGDHLAKAVCHAIKIECVAPRLAQFLYQEFMLEGGDVVLPHLFPAPAGSPAVDVLLLGTAYQFRHLVVRLRSQHSILSGSDEEGELELLAAELDSALSRYAGTPRGRLPLRSKTHVWGERTLVMGILNVTPDSSGEDGVMAHAAQRTIEQAVVQAERMVADGADILDIGGEWTRNGLQPTLADAEFGRVLDALKRIRERVSVPISIATHRAEVARAALDAGADWVNDVEGLRMDPEMRRLAAERKVPVVIVHDRSSPREAVHSERLGGTHAGVDDADLMGDVIGELRAQTELALDAGIAPDKIIVDPGIGLGKTREQNLELLNRADELRILGYPVLVSPWLNGLTGFALDLPVAERVQGTAAAVTIAILRGADIVRVHDVPATAAVARIADAIVRSPHAGTRAGRGGAPISPGSDFGALTLLC